MQIRPSSRVVAVLLFSVVPLLPSGACAQFALDAMNAASLQALPPLSVPAVIPVQAQETYPDMEQDRKPVKLLYSARGVSVLDSVRFERDAAANTYRWGQLKLDEAALDEAYFGFRSASVGHSFLMFSFKDGTRVVVELLPWKKKGEKFDPMVAGMSGKYAVVWNVVEWRSFLETAVGRDGLYVDVYPLKISREEKVKLLSEAVAEASRDHAGEKYNTLTNSCSTNALKVLSRATGRHLLIANRLPSVVIEHLKLRGLLGERERSDASNWQR